MGIDVDVETGKCVQFVLGSPWERTKPFRKRQAEQVELWSQKCPKIAMLLVALAKSKTGRSISSREACEVLRLNASNGNTLDKSTRRTLRGHLKDFGKRLREKLGHYLHDPTTGDGPKNPAIFRLEDTGNGVDVLSRVTLTIINAPDSQRVR